LLATLFRSKVSATIWSRLAMVKRHQGEHMRIIGLPIDSFVVLIVVPAVIVVYQFYYCWQVFTGRRD
jgi:hypothetical protein